MPWSSSPPLFVAPAAVARRYSMCPPPATTRPDSCPRLQISPLVNRAGVPAVSRTGGRDMRVLRLRKALAMLGLAVGVGIGAGGCVLVPAPTPVAVAPAPVVIAPRPAVVVPGPYVYHGYRRWWW